MNISKILKSETNLSIIFFLVLTLNIIFSEVYPFGVWFTKPLLMPILAYIVYLSSNENNKFLYLALFFSFLGDVLLQFTFIPGLVAFLIAHIFYIVIFSKNTRLSFFKSISMVIITVLYFLFLKNHLTSELFIPVLIYCIAITLMAVFAINRTNRSKGINYVLIGALLFVISDSCIAYNKFVESIPNSTFWIMSTYGLAQWFIIKGLIKES